VVSLQAGNAFELTSNNYAEEGQTSDPSIETVDPLKHYGVERQEQIEEPVDESHVDANQQNDGLSEQHAHWSAQILLEKLL
jgi:hypothetical protein